MTDDDILPDTDDTIWPAAEVRRRTAQLDKARRARAEAKRREQASARAARLRAFAGAHLTMADIDNIKQKVRAAVERGEFEAQIARFPSGTLTDRGRAINNGDRDWPNTLTGPAADLYAVFLSRARPKGYRLRARILDYPDGMPGDVGLYLDWT